MAFILCMEINVLTQVLLLKQGFTLYLLLVLTFSFFQLLSTTWRNLYLHFPLSPSHPLLQFLSPFLTLQ